MTHRIPFAGLLLELVDQELPEAARRVVQVNVSLGDREDAHHDAPTHYYFMDDGYLVVYVGSRGRAGRENQTLHRVYSSIVRSLLRKHVRKRTQLTQTLVHKITQD